MRFEFHGCSRCDEPNYRWPQPYCHTCHSAYMREYRTRHGTKLSADQARREKARQRSRTALRKGLILRSPCWVCGSPKAEMHHPDYGHPEDIWWLCPDCRMMIRRVKQVAEVKVDLRKPPSWAAQN